MTNKGKVLLIEDNPANLELFVDILDVGGYQCIYTSKGEETLELARMERPDLILLDIQLPGIDGLSVGRLLKSLEETKHIKIIAFTAHAMSGDREKFLQEGFDGYIPKPIKMKEFLGEIEKHISAGPA